MLELRQWTVVDPQGLATTVSIRESAEGIPLEPVAVRNSGRWIQSRVNSKKYVVAASGS